MTTKRLTGKAAQEAWPARLTEARLNPSDEALQRLCGLLDAIDAWVVRRWRSQGHQERREALAQARREAAEVNRAVSEAVRAGRAERGAKLAAVRKQAKGVKL